MKRAFTPNQKRVRAELLERQAEARNRMRCTLWPVPLVIPMRTTSKFMGVTLVEEFTAERNADGKFRGIHTVNGQEAFATQWIYSSGGAAKAAAIEIYHGNNFEALSTKDLVLQFAAFLVLVGLLVWLACVLL